MAFAVNLAGWDGTDGYGVYRPRGQQSIFAKSHDRRGLALPANATTDFKALAAFMYSYEWRANNNALGPCMRISGARDVQGYYSARDVFAGASVNRTGLTQCRLHFAKDDNDGGADYLSVYSGNAPLAMRPILEIRYETP